MLITSRDGLFVIQEAEAGASGRHYQTGVWQRTTMGLTSLGLDALVLAESVVCKGPRPEDRLDSELALGLAMFYSTYGSKS